MKKKKNKKLLLLTVALIGKDSAALSLPQDAAESVSASPLDLGYAQIPSLDEPQESFSLGSLDQTAKKSPNYEQEAASSSSLGTIAQGAGRSINNGSRIESNTS